MRNYYKYKAYNLVIHSTVELPALREYMEGTPDVVIEEVSELIQLKEEGKEEFMLSVKEVGRYYIAEGRKIEFERLKGVKDESIAVFLLGWCIGIILLQRDILPIHGSAVAKAGKCILFAGASGAGKSTIATKLKEKGFKLINDDICAISFDERKKPFVHLGQRYTRLRKDSTEALGIDSSTLGKAFNDEKYYVKLEEELEEEALEVSALYYISLTEGEEDIEIIPERGISKVEVILQNIFVDTCMKTQKRQLLFQKCSELSKNILVKTIYRPEGFIEPRFIVNKLCEDLIEEGLLWQAEA